MGASGIGLYSSDFALDLTGSISESGLTASVAGRRVNWLVRFTKQYDGAGGKTHRVEYVGEVNEDATQINGRWLIEGKASGLFAMDKDN